MTTQVEPAATRPERFPSPFDVSAPPGAEGWQEMYPYYLLFSEQRRDFEDGKLWFFDSMHWPDPVYPFDVITAECTQISIGEFNTRIFAVPPALGLDHRVLNGYMYLSPQPVRDPEEIGRRVELFKERAGYYFQNWSRLYDQWREKMTAHIAELRGIHIPELPALDDIAIVTEGRGISTGAMLLQEYNRLINSIFKAWSYHFELLNLGYVAYLTFFQSCQQWFPGIADDTVAKMVAGIDVLLFRPDDEVKNLARLAIELGIAELFKREGRGVDEVMAELRQSDPGQRWLAALEEVKDPWFHFSSGTGIGGHFERSWVDDLSIPLASLRGYIGKLEQGEAIARPTEHVRAERERLAQEYRALLQTGPDQQAFDELLGLSRTVFPYIEDHNFYVEHWYHTIFWNKMREVGRELTRGGFLSEPDDVFFLNRHEVAQALYDLVASWAVGTPARGPAYWPLIVDRRKQIHGTLKGWRPPPALGPVPEVIADAFTIMLWGLTTERVQGWLTPAGEPGQVKELRGVAASPGVVEGPARVVLSAAELDGVEPGEVLVCPITAPSWVPVVFTRIVAAVSDIGGIMSHAAIVSREYGLPAVVGTGVGTQAIQTGQRLRVDGDKGVVTILD